MRLYSPLLLEVVHRFERDEDTASDCYLFVCERLSCNGFRRLLRFRPGGPARFSTWLRAVARNLCLDWHRRQCGRHRVFESVARLPALEQEVFRSLFIECLPIEEAFLKLEPRNPGLTPEKVADAATHVQQALTSRQRWLLTARRTRGLVGQDGSPGQIEAEFLQLPSEMPNPETWAGVQEERAALRHAMSKRSPRERLLIRLRFERDMTLNEIARVLNLDSPQGVDRRIREVLEMLQRDMARIGKPSLPSV